MPIAMRTPAQPVARAARPAGSASPPATATPAPLEAAAAAAAMTIAAMSSSEAIAPMSVSARAPARSAGPRPLSDGRRLLVEEHPGHDDRTDRRDDELEIPGPIERLGR